MYDLLPHLLYFIASPSIYYILYHMLSYILHHPAYLLSIFTHKPLAYLTPEFIPVRRYEETLKGSVPLKVRQTPGC